MIVEEFESYLDYNFYISEELYLKLKEMVDKFGVDSGSDIVATGNYFSVSGGDVKGGILQYLLLTRSGPELRLRMNLNDVIVSSRKWARLI